MGSLERDETLSIDADLMSMSNTPRRNRALLWVGLATSTLAAAFALLSGFVSEAESTTYHWSLGDSSDEVGNAQLLDSSSGFTPLLLAAHVPERIKARWTCYITRGKAEMEEPFDLISTSNDSTNPRGLRVVAVNSGAYEVFVRGQVIAHLSSADIRSDESCVYEVLIDRAGRWVLRRANETIASASGELPVVTGISTDLNAASFEPGSFISLDIRTIAHGPSASVPRAVSRIAGAVLVGASIILLVATSSVGVIRRTRRAQTGAYGIRARHETRWLDHAIVITVLLAWWLVGPAFFDDGWILADMTNFDSDGIFASYYDTFNAAIPLGYAHYLLMRLFASVSTAFLWLRVPALLAGLGTWLIVRSTVDRGVRALRSTAGLGTHMATASVFLLSWISWNNTLRPEPLLALLVAVSLWVSVQYVDQPNPRYLLAGSMTVALSMSIHPAGLVSLAGLMVATPEVLAWLKRHRPDGLYWLGIAALVGIAILVLAVWTVGDAGFWWRSVSILSTEEHHSSGLRDELARYQGLFLNGLGNSSRQLVVFLPLMAPIMFLLRRHRMPKSPANVAVLAYVAACLLLTLTQSKWIWHFGSLAPLAATAIGIETHRWWIEREWHTVKLFGPIIVLTGVLALVTVAWSHGLYWNVIELGPLGQLDRSHGLVGVLTSHPILALAAALVMLTMVRLTLSWRTSSGWSIKTALFEASICLTPAAAMVAVALSVGAFWATGFSTSSEWSLARQNVDELSSQNCGLADTLHLVDPDSSKPDSSLQMFLDEQTGPVLVAPQIRMYFPCIRQPAIQNGTAEIPRVIISSGGWPNGLAGSPYYHLDDVAVLQPIKTSLPDSSQRIPIDVIVVETTIEDNQEFDVP